MEDEDALRRVLDASATLDLVAVVGLPASCGGLLFNVAAVIERGRLLGVVPKTFLPGYREFYETRQFQPSGAAPRTIDLAAQAGVPFGADLQYSDAVTIMRSFEGRRGVE